MRSVNYGELELQAICELLERKPRQWARDNGYIIDDSRYPPQARKGSHLELVPTEAEQALLDSVREARAEKADLEIKAGVFIPETGTSEMGTRCFTCGAPEIEESGEIMCSRPGCTHN